MFVDGWLLKANECETVSLRTELSASGLPTANQVLLGDTGFDDGQLFELCRKQGSLLITPLRINDDSSLERLQRQILYEEWDNCRLYKRRSLSIEPLWSYVKELFDLSELHQHGIFAGAAEVLSAMVSYDLIVLYNHLEGLKPRAVKSFLDVL